MKKCIVFAGLLALFGCNKSSDVFTDKNGVAINGYDPVAYFTESKPVKGNTEHSLKMNDVTWLFASERNKQEFERNPLKYTPQYGGYCAFGMSNGYKAPTSPDAWTIVDEKLYLNYNTEVQGSWRAEKDKRIPDADANWQKVATSETPPGK